MTTFKPGDRVRCVDDDDGIHQGPVHGSDYVVGFQDDATRLVHIDDLWGEWSPTRFVLLPTAQPASVPEAAVVCVPDDQPDPVRDWQARAAEKAKRYQPKEQWFWFDVPSEASEGSLGVGRAVDRLSQHEPRLGCHAWRP
jgi:hypothetical protein